MKMKNDAKFGKELIFRFKIVIQNWRNFDQDTQKFALH